MSFPELAYIMINTVTHSIITTLCNLHQVVKDWMLACMVGVLVAIDLLFMIVTLSVPQLMVKAAIVPNQENPISEVGVSSATCYMQCTLCYILCICILH